MKTTILSTDTICELAEAHASLVAWYHAHANAVHAQALVVAAPDEAERLAALTQLSESYPEVASAIATITSPRNYIPPPPRHTLPATPAAVAAPDAVDPIAPPALVDAADVRYDSSADDA